MKFLICFEILSLVLQLLNNFAYSHANLLENTIYFS